MQNKNELIRVEHLTKRFTEVTAVDDLSFSVSRGEVYGFLGQNGAGKSTTIRMLLTLIRPTSGMITLFGKDIRFHRNELLQNVGAIIEKPDLYNYLTAWQNIKIMAKLSGTAPSDKECREILEKTGIAERANSKVRTFSQGMKQRLGIACALVHDPELIILDEPTNGLDPQGIADVRNLILHLSKEEGKTVFVSSHLLSEIEVLADSMLIIDKGKKVAEGKVSELLSPAHTLVEVQTTDDSNARTILLQSPWAGYLQATGKSITLKMHQKEVPDLASFLIGRGVSILSLRPKHSLEDYFLSLTTPGQHVPAYKN